MMLVCRIYNIVKEKENVANSCVSLFRFRPIILSKWNKRSTQEIIRVIMPSEEMHVDSLFFNKPTMYGELSFNSDERLHFSTDRGLAWADDSTMEGIRSHVATQINISTLETINL